MSIFGRILDKLGLGKDDRKGSPTAGTQAQAGRPTGSTAPTQTSPHTSAPGAQRSAPPPSPQQAQAARPKAMSETDVVAKLEKLAADNPQQLNWRTSIVDLMKLLGMDSSLAERKELAAELGYPRDQMDDSAKMNIWLHKQVLRKVAENGGNVPKELLD
ncbi:MAG TPA: DUF3597 domain-containing protein [Steroidobacteraceae bacterium]|jgi:hypothetical protein|nr:DUF3597 domain-containing protein [Steroidobacteraceae bacterium]